MATEISTRPLSPFPHTFQLHREEDEFHCKIWVTQSRQGCLPEPIDRIIQSSTSETKRKKIGKSKVQNKQRGQSDSEPISEKSVERCDLLRADKNKATLQDKSPTWCTSRRHPEHRGLISVHRLLLRRLRPRRSSRRPKRMLDGY